MNMKNLFKRKTVTSAEAAPHRKSQLPGRFSRGQWSIRAKLAAVIIASVLVTVSVAAIGLVVVNGLATAFFRVSQEMPAKLQALADIESASLWLLSETRDHLLIGNDDALVEAEKAKAQLDTALTAYTTAVSKSNPRIAEEQVLADDLERMALDLIRKADALELSHRSGASDEKIKAAMNELETTEDALAEKLVEVQTLSLNERMAGIKRIDRVINMTQSLMIFYPLAASIVLLIASSFIGRLISARLKELNETARQIIAGDMTTRNNVLGNDELGVLGQSLNLMVDKLGTSITRLEREGKQLQTVMQVGRSLVALLSVDEVLAELVNLTKETFNYYHTHIYLLDEQQKKLRLAYGYGSAGAEMKARGYAIDLLAPTSLVARAARTAEVVWVGNVREDPDWLPNELLPETYSEISVPIVVEGKVVGVLDAQEREVDGFDESDAVLFLALAGQAAVAIKNARLFAGVESALIEARETQKQYVQQGWDRDKVARRGAGQAHFSLMVQDVLPESAIEQARQLAVQYKQPTSFTMAQLSDGSQASAQPGSGLASAGRQALVAPIIIKDVPIGNMQFHHIDPDRVWTEGELAVINTVLVQLAQVAEQQRLFDETQERASRERLLAEIGDKMRRAPSLEALMKVTTAELSKALNPMRVYAQLGFAPADKEPPAPPSAEPAVAEVTPPAEPDTEPLPPDSAQATNGHSPRVNGRQPGAANHPSVSGESL